MSHVLMQATIHADWTRGVMCHAGSFGRTMEDLVLLDSVIRTQNATTDELGGLPVPVSCAANIDRSMNLTGLKLGLPSNFGWISPGLSGEVSTLPHLLHLPSPPSPFPSPTIFACSVVDCGRQWARSQTLVLTVASVVASG